MSLQQPTTQEVSDNIISQLEASLNQTIPLLPKAFVRVLAKAMAGVFVLLYKFAGFVFLQLFVATASARPVTINGRTLTPLIEWGRLVGAGDPVAATQAELTADVTVTNQTGSLASGSQLVSDDTGVTYITVGSVLLNAPVVSVTVRAVSDQAGGDGSGAIGNLPVGEVISFANPLANVARDTVVTGAVTTGANAESTAAYRQRVIDRFQKRPQGGAYADYKLWGEEVPGILNVYPYTDVFPGQVRLYVEATPASSGNPDGIPTNAQLTAVLDAVNLDPSGLATRRPASALPLANAITRTGFAVRVQALAVDDESAVRVQIEDALRAYFLQRAPYIEGLTVGVRADQIFQDDVSIIVRDIVRLAGGVVSAVTLLLGAAPTLAYNLGEGEKAKLTGVSYV